MKTRQVRESYELGYRNLTLTIQVRGCIYPEEPMVRYYRDGSGYPGCPAEAEIELWVSNVTGDFGTVDRNERNNDWFKILDSVAQDYLEYFENKVLEDAAERD